MKHLIFGMWCALYLMIWDLMVSLIAIHCFFLPCCPWCPWCPWCHVRPGLPSWLLSTSIINGYWWPCAINANLSGCALAICCFLTGSSCFLPCCPWCPWCHVRPGLPSWLLSTSIINGYWWQGSINANVSGSALAMCACISSDPGRFKWHFR